MMIHVAQGSLTKTVVPPYFFAIAAVQTSNHAMNYEPLQ